MTRGSGPGSAHVALLRGVNVGGRNKLSMGEIASAFEDIGCGEVRTYIQSGNVVFRAPARLAARLPGLAADRIARGAGFRPGVFVRTAKELGDAVRNNPYGPSATKALHVGFLATAPGPGAVARLDPRRSPPDSFAVRWREIYLHCPNGMGRTRLSGAYFESVLEEDVTFRNWRTVLALLEMTGG
ncbi:MAG TPA: DUF1697 domain-containing protein [Anaeromyxobacteraceae bacterium]|nr:DUF1697 domain-containing protein [Anaeromyxobacteraceae bacterium]